MRGHQGQVHEGHVGDAMAEAEISAAQEGHHDIAQGIFLQEADLGSGAMG